MPLSPLLLLAVLSAVALLVYFYPAWRQRRLLKQPFPAAWQAIVLRRLPFFARFSAAEQAQLHDLIRLFIAGKQFHGCGGLAITDEIRVSIAAMACLLLLNRRTGIFPGLQHILVYPQGFIATDREELNEDGTVSIASVDLLGESWEYGKVILSWDDIEEDTANFGDGHNVVLHEFAHQLDSEDGDANGAPVLKSGSNEQWAQVLSREFAALVSAAERGEQGVLDHYGASDPAEFFAVATETFFERPAELEQQHPELFGVLLQYYRVDPRQWQQEGELDRQLFAPARGSRP